MPEPTLKRAWAFFDGQNLYHAAKEAFGYRLPNYDVQKLVLRLCEERNWSLTATHFYTGIPDAVDNPFWNQFWSAKLAFMGRHGVRVFSRKLRYRNQTVRIPNGQKYTFLVGQEKGIDIRIALDVVRAVHRNECDVALLFSQDQDLSEVADEVRLIAHEQRRWIKIASAFPFSPTVHNKRGVNKTDWIPIGRTAYDACPDKTIF